MGLEFRRVLFRSFGGDDYDEGTSVGYHFEQGPDGGIVELDDATILDRARSMIPRY